MSPSLCAQTVEYIHTDALGTPIAVTNASRVVIERSEYEPYGKLLNRPLTDGPGFTGHVQDAATGMTYMQQRYYDPAVGRFLSVDPVAADPSNGANFNRYQYANSNPYKFKDPDGRAGCSLPTGSHICMSENALSSKLGAIEKSERGKSYSTPNRAARAFANRALPLQAASGREIGANMEQKNEKSYSLMDFSFNSGSEARGQVNIPTYNGMYKYFGIVHTHPETKDRYRNFSGAGASAKNGKFYNVGPTDGTDVAISFRRNVVMYVADPEGSLFSFDPSDWRKAAASNPGTTQYAGWQEKQINE